MKVRASVMIGSGMVAENSIACRVVGDLPQNALDVGQEAQVEHLVGLVEYQHRQVRRAAGGLLGEVEQEADSGYHGIDRNSTSSQPAAPPARSTAPQRAPPSCSSQLSTTRAANATSSTTSLMNAPPPAGHPPPPGPAQARGSLRSEFTTSGGTIVSPPEQQLAKVRWHDDIIVCHATQARPRSTTTSSELRTTQMDHCSRPKQDDQRNRTRPIHR